MNRWCKCYLLYSILHTLLGFPYSYLGSLCRFGRVGCKNVRLFADAMIEYLDVVVVVGVQTSPTRVFFICRWAVAGGG